MAASPPPDEIHAGGDVAMRYPRKKAGEKHRRYGTKRRPFHLEVLEHRRMLATFTVTNLMDSGPGSLRDALTQANGDASHDNIEFDSALAGGTIAVTSGQLQVLQSLTINGPGADQLTVDAEGRSRVFLIDNFNGGVQSDVYLNGLTITGGHAFKGSGIFSPENLTLDDVVISGNTSSDDFASGAGIFHTLGQLTINDSIVSDNTTYGDNSVGGGLYSGFNTAVLTDTVISGNATHGNDADGGGIFNVAGDLTLIRSDVSGNTTEGMGSVGGGLGAINATTRLVDSSILDNRTIGDQGRGGGVSVDGGTLEVSSTSVSGNATTGDDSQRRRDFCS